MFNIQKKRIINYIILFMLCLACFMSAENISQQCRHISVRYTQSFIKEETAKNVIQYLQSKSNINGINCAFLRSEKAEIKTELRETKIDIIFYMASSGDSACYITNSAAQALYGSAEASGLTFSINNNNYTISNVIKSKQKIVAVGVSSGEFTDIEMSGDFGNDSQSAVNDFIAKAKLNTSSGVLYRQSLAQIAFVLCFIPLAICFIFAIFILIKYICSLKGINKDIALFVFGLLCVAIIVIGANAVPSYLLPAKISDIGAFKEILNEINRKIDELIMLPPRISDIPLWRALSAHFILVIASAFAAVHLCFTKKICK
ncbi:MAG: hypothetical protein RR424_02710 [Oscillospiraceae bacterium]